MPAKILAPVTIVRLIHNIILSPKMIIKNNRSLSQAIKQFLRPK